MLLLSIPMLLLAVTSSAAQQPAESTESTTTAPVAAAAPASLLPQQLPQQPLPLLGKVIPPARPRRHLLSIPLLPGRRTRIPLPSRRRTPAITRRRPPTVPSPAARARILFSLQLPRKPFILVLVVIPGVAGGVVGIDLCVARRGLVGPAGVGGRGVVVDARGQGGGGGEVPLGGFGVGVYVEPGGDGLGWCWVGRVRGGGGRVMRSMVSLWGVGSRLTIPCTGRSSGRPSLRGLWAEEGRTGRRSRPCLVRRASEYRVEVGW